MHFGGYRLDILVQGYPGKTRRHGGLGWSTVALLRGHGRVAIVDTGGFSMRRIIVEALQHLDVQPGDVTDLLLTHLHYDHMINWTLFPNARITVGQTELGWALGLPMGDPIVPEFYVRELALHPKLSTVGDGAEVLPGITAYLVPGHTPGHLMFLVPGRDDETHGDLLLVQDAAKYRAELLLRAADMTFDAAITAASIERIWGFWRRRPGSLLVPGHDQPMVLQDGVPTRLGRADAAIIAIMGETLTDRTEFDLAGPPGG
ncbi:MBL fold metallo-hydrolase [Acidisphaera sp. L21]|uniref:MBL fold metallo-hydrolase n=1 Tax=Acidisphaera sp. L21 TaxID=1641851 RepID=UPI00131C395B|nr:MBL fold metallo-hydrolase [Acidisphaera sp. L21]